MKLKQEITKEQLIELGFFDPNLELSFEDEYDYFNESCSLLYRIGHSRRGQMYYIGIFDETREILLFATKPDGDGGSIEVGDIFTKLIQNNFIEL